MYQEKLAIAVKINGKVLREFKDTVFLPFGAEYSFFVKNLNSVRCLVNIEIDGEDVADGNSFVVPANGFIDIERFLKNNNKEAGQRFKFIERTSRIEEHRGVGVEDGLIRIQYEFERPADPVYPSTYWVKREYWDGPYPSYPYGSALRSTKFGSTSSSGPAPTGLSDIQCSAARGITGETAASFSASASASVTRDSYAIPQNAVPLNDAGITVGGSISEQKFVDAAWFPTDGIKHVMVVKLLGERGQQAVKTPVCVKTKQRCPTCGHMNKSHARFCGECGTGLAEPQ